MVGLPSYSGEGTFADVWRRALELNGYLVEEVPVEGSGQIHERVYCVRCGSDFIECCGFKGRRTKDGWSMEGSLYSIILAIHRMRGNKQRGLFVDVHHILACTGARIQQGYDGGFTLFRSTHSKEDLVGLLNDVLGANSLELRDSEPTNTRGVTHGVVNDVASRRNIAEVLLGRAIDHLSGKTCSFLAIRSTRWIARAAEMLSIYRRSNVIELCSQLPQMTRIGAETGSGVSVDA